MRFVIALGVLLVLVAAPAFATLYTWGGGATGTWQTGANWTPAAPTGGPTSTDCAFIVSPVANNVSVSASGDITVGEIRVQAPIQALADTFTYDGNTSLTCASGVFTSSMVGATVWVTGKQILTVTAYASATSVTVTKSGSAFTSIANAVLGRSPTLSPGASYVLNVTTAGGGTGNLYLVTDTSIAAKELDVWGNVFVSPYSSLNSAESFTWNLRGTNQAFRDTSCRAGTSINVWGTGAYDNGCFQMYDNKVRFTVEHGAKLGNTASTAQGWSSSEFIFTDGQANMPDWGSKVNFTYYGNYGSDNGLKKYAINGAVAYPNDVAINFGYEGNTKKNGITWRVVGGNLKIGEDFNLAGPGVSQYSGPVIYGDGDMRFTTQDNATSVWRNLTVGRDMNIGTGVLAGTAAYPDCVAIAVAHFGNSVVSIGRDLNVGTRSDGSYQPTGSADLGNATIYLGRNLKIYDPTVKFSNYTRTISAWNAGGSTVICNGNGTAYHYTQLLTINSDRGFSLNSLIVNNPGGSVWLDNSSVAAGSLKLTGNLEIDCGSFKGWGRKISFNGPSHTITNYVNPSTYQFDDNINLLTGTTVLALGSNITIKTGDNLNMASGSIIYLCGFLLKADGKTYDGSLTGSSWTNDGGTIYALSNVPEPATLLLLGTGLMGAIGWARRKRMT